ncbi:MAG: TlpA family protein disulfide reductase [Gemmatimonadales bacterium]
MLVATAVAVAAGAAPSAAQVEAGIRVGAAAPVVSVDDLDGKPVDLGQWIGKKPVLLEFWATWCPNCEELLPRVKDAWKTYGEQVQFIGVNVTVNQKPDRVRRYIAEHEIPFLVLFDDKATSIRAYQAPSTAYFVITDASGKVFYTGLGVDQQFEAALKAVTASR